MSTRVRAMVGFGGEDDEPRPWDGLLVEERMVIDKMDLLCRNELIARLWRDGRFAITDQKTGALVPSTDLAALGRAFYIAMLGKEPPP